MVQSKGTRPDSHLFRMDFTGSRKYSGRSSDLRRVGATGEIEARRAMPTSGSAPGGAEPGTARAASFRKSCGLRRGSPQKAGANGGQSETPLSGTTLPGPGNGASSRVRVLVLRSG